MEVTTMTKRVTTDTLNFVQNHVLNVTDLVRTKKLSEILDQYADTKSTEVFIVQNDKKRNAKGVILDLEYFTELLHYKEAVEEAIDDYMIQVVTERKDDLANLTLDEILAESSITKEELDAAMNEVELDDEN
ncbi:MAG: hypothetical protein A2201_02905 [Alicyclobacillus sp. RIFOXYA1_FULL_53_8]|nr:MAG: hypothetical protein A2201_02905 [Alicyclobacillus sp. RIFOXYA1_FULL_53_8]